MRKRALAAGLALVVWPVVAVIRGLAQQSGTTVLVLRVPPEARVDPPQVPLAFRVSEDGSSDVTTSPAVVVARVRAYAGQAIHINALLASLQGPGGVLPASAVSWTGSATNATGAARQAACSNGVFGTSAVQDLVAGWQTSGILTCAINFELVQPRSLAPGAYSGLVRLSVETQ
jgi:hypothetical protein